MTTDISKKLGLYINVGIINETYKYANKRRLIRMYIKV